MKLIPQNKSHDCVHLVNQPGIDLNFPFCIYGNGQEIILLPFSV